VPELPEVETIVADLRPHLTGRTIVRCELLFPTIVRYPEPEVFVDSVAGMRISAVTRRGKFILMHLDNALLLVVHLGMTGQLRIVDADAPIEKHTHAIFTLDGDSAPPPGATRRPARKRDQDGTYRMPRRAGRYPQLRYRDPRRFGRLLLGTEESLLASKKLPRLGPEPIDPSFVPDELYRSLRKRRTSLKAVLLDQGAIAGVGNIYADESLHRARLRPDRVAAGLSRKSAQRLHESLRDSLLMAIKNRGSSVDTYRDAWGNIGGQQEKLLVYGRAGEPCFTCGRPLAMIRLAGRSTVFCTKCQR
jgi:formamidopyrimidine-DNA glycosylase